ncbi:MAG: flagellar basal body rod protein FlgB [Eubacteriales bacterium]|nr:flagellar basal body rod protein FlgB [Eubacteriales bacterium]
MIGDSLITVFLQKAMDGTWQRQKVISNNIANHETPGYKAQKVSFEKALKNEINKYTKGSDGVRNVKIRVSTDYSVSERMDGNNVNIDVENINMVKTQIQYQYLIRGISDQFSRLKYAISEGRR